MNRWLVLIFLLALGAKLLFFSTHVPFTQDQVKDVWAARQAVETGNFLIPYGPKASVGVFIPPLYYYLELVGQVVFRGNFYATDYLVILLESLTPVLLCYLVYKMTNDRLAAVASALVYAVAPGVLIASNAWNPNLVPLFGLLFVFSFVSYLVERRNRWLLTGITSLVILINLHFQWFVLLPLLAVMLVLSIVDLKASWKALLLAVVAGLILLSPYLVYESKNGWTNTKAAFGFLKNKELIYERVRKPVYVAFFFSNFYQRMMVGDTFVKSWEKQYEVFQTAMIVGSVVFWMIMAAVIWNLRKKNKYLAAYLAAFGMMFVFLRFYKGDKPDFYLYVFLNYIFGFLGVVLAGKKRIGLLVFGLIGGLELMAVANIVPFNDYRSYQEINDKIRGLPEAIEVRPLNQELVIPLKYWLNDQYFTKKVGGEGFVVLVCYATQACDQYQPNTKSPVNVFKYNNIDPMDFSDYWPGYKAKESFVLRAGKYTANFLRTD